MTDGQTYGSGRGSRGVDDPRPVALGLLTSGRHVLLERRPEGGPLAGLWQFPGGKVRFGEHPWDALRRELWEELRLRVARGTLFGVYSHVYDLGGTRVHYILVAYRVAVARARVKETPGLRWVDPPGLRRLSVVPGSRPIVTDLLRR